MRKLHLMPALLAGLFAMAPVRAQAPTSIDLSGTWKFFKGDNLTWAKPEFDDTLWKDINVPGSWQSQGNPELTGYAWYRKHVPLPADWGNNSLVKDGKTLWLDLGTINDAYEVYWNGAKIGEGGKFLPNFVAATGVARAGVPSDQTRFGGDNVLAIRVYDKTAPGGITAGPVILREPTYADFITVRVEGKADNNGRPRTEFTGPEGLPIDIVVENTGPAEWQNGTVMATLLDDTGKPLTSSPVSVDVAAGKARRVSMNIPEATLNPGIYTIVADVQMNGRTLNSGAETFVYNPAGIRTETFRTVAQIQAFQPKLDQFWKTTISSLKNTPIGGTSTLDTAKSTDQVKVYKVSYNALNGQTIYGWLVTPANATKTPGLLVMPLEGNAAVEPPVFLAEAGFTALAINAHGSDVNAASYPSIADDYVKNAADPNKYYYRGMIAAGLRGLDYLAQRPEVNADHIGVLGGSEGGALAIDVAALDPRTGPTSRVKAVVANSPEADFPRIFESAPANPMAKVVTALSPSVQADLRGTLAYFDPAILADRLRSPLLITIGMRDAITPPETAYAVKNAAPHDLTIIINADKTAGHGPTPAQQQFSLQWLRKLLIG